MNSIFHTKGLFASETAHDKKYVLGTSLCSYEYLFHESTVIIDYTADLVIFAYLIFCEFLILGLFTKISRIFIFL